MKNTALIFDVKHFSIHDGDGIRTTVFFKGCPLSCIWCHNPEGISPNPEICYYDHKCIKCGVCQEVCEANAHKMQTDVHIYDKNSCIKCGKCESECLGEAIKLYGKRVGIDELIGELITDKMFYDTSGGGVTLSGGECLIQADFCRELLSELKKIGIHTAVDTSGYVPRGSIDKVAPFTDIFLYDIKAYSEDVHIKCTGHPNALILDNLKYIDSLGKKIEIRIPFVPNYNDEEIEAIAELLKSLNNVTRVKLLPYHSYAASKYSALGMPCTLPERIPVEEELEAARGIIRAAGLECV